MTVLKQIDKRQTVVILDGISPGIAGIIKPYAGDTSTWSTVGSLKIKSGHTPCEGQVLEQADYPDLYNAIGNAWDTFNHPVDGTPSVGVGQFALPNLKGLGLTGVGNNGATSYTLATYYSDLTAVNGLLAASSSVTGTINNTNIAHTHDVNISHDHGTAGTSHDHGQVIQQTASGSSIGPDVDTTIGAFNIYNQTEAVTVNLSNYSNTVSSGAMSANQSHGHTFTLTADAQGLTGDGETRSRTAGVSYIISLWDNEATSLSVNTTKTETLEVTNAATVGSISGPGTVPLGTIIAIMDDYSNITIPVSGDVTVDGFQLCDGAALHIDSVLGTGSTLGSNTPDLSNGRFLRGFTTSGTTGGAAAVTLIEANLPAHTHVMTHGHGHNITTLNDTHNHGITDPGHTHREVGANTGVSGSLRGAVSDATTDTNYTWDYYTLSSTTGITINNDTHNHAISGGVTDFTGNTGSVGSGASFSIEPSFMNVKYLIRIK